MRYLAIFVLIIASLTSCAAQTAQIGVPKAGNYYYWLTYTDVNGKLATTTPCSFKDKQTTIDLPMVKDNPAKSTLYVLDSDTGNESISTEEAKLAQSLKINLQASDFNIVRRVEIQVSSSASQLPAAAAVVELESGGPAQTQVLDPSDRGSVFFTDVHTGTAKVTVEYGEGKSTSQDIDIPAERKTPVLIVRIPVAAEIETVKPATSTALLHPHSTWARRSRACSYSS
jgi:hypothetical protein